MLLPGPIHGPRTRNRLLKLAPMSWPGPRRVKAIPSQGVGDARTIRWSLHAESGDHPLDCGSRSWYEKGEARRALQVHEGLIGALDANERRSKP